MEQLDGSNLSDAEFDAVLTEIDDQLRTESDRIVGREIRGWMKFCQRFQMSFLLADPLAGRIVEWFKVLYGSRLNVDMDFGKSFVAIRGDTYRLRCFRFYGAMYAICSIEAIGRDICERTSQGIERRAVNLLDDSIEELTPELARRLSLLECSEILKRYAEMFLAFSGMEGALSSRYGGTDAPYMKEAMDDLLESSESILARRPNYGQSNWASLQAAEKVIKSYILEKGGTHGKIHKLDELCKFATQVGLRPISQALIQAIQCKPEVRYDSTLVTKDKALAAHKAALMVCGLTAGFMRRSTAQAALKNVQIRISGGAPIDALLLGYQPPTPPFLTRPSLTNVGVW